MNINFEEFDNSQPHHQGASALVSEWSKNAAAMLTLKPEDLDTYPYSVLAFNPQAVPLGHIAVVKYEAGEATVGRFVVNPDYRGQGVGRAIIQYFVGSVAQALPGMQSCLVYTSYKSLEIFEQAGGVFVGYREPLLRGRANHITNLMPAIK